jgi:hypothetical protein
MNLPPAMGMLLHYTNATFTRANRTQLLRAIDLANDPANRVVISSEEWHEKYRFDSDYECEQLLLQIISWLSCNKNGNFGNLLETFLNFY